MDYYLQRRCLFLRGNIGSEKKDLHSITKVFDFYEKVTSILDKRDGWIVVLGLKKSFEKSFETVAQWKLVKKLDFQAAISRRLHWWIESYLSRKEWRTNVRGAFIVGWNNHWHTTRLDIKTVGILAFYRLFNFRNVSLTEYVSRWFRNVEFMRDVWNGKDCFNLQ